MALSNALDGVIKAWTSLSDDGSAVEQAVRPPLVWLWASMQGLSELAKSNRVDVNIAGLSAQLDGSVRHFAALATAAEKDTGRWSVASAEIARLATKGARVDIAFMQILSMLEVCPFSGVIQRVAVLCWRQIVDAERERSRVNDLSMETPPDECRWRSGDQGLCELSANAEASVLRVSVRLFTALRSRDDVGKNSAYEDTISLVRFLVALPLRPGTAWRVYLLVSAALLFVMPRFRPDEKLLLALPSPQALLTSHAEGESVHGGLGAEETDDNIRLANASKLLSDALRSCDSNRLL